MKKAEKLKLVSSEHIYLELPITKQNYLDCQDKCASAEHWLHILLWNSLISLFWVFFFFVNFLRLSTPQRASVFPHKGRSRQNLSFSSFIKGRFSHSGRKHGKVAYFWKTDETELWKRNPKGKKIQRRSMSKRHGESSTLPCHGLCFWKTFHPYLQES